MGKKKMSKMQELTQKYNRRRREILKNKKVSLDKLTKYYKHQIDKLNGWYDDSLARIKKKMKLGIRII